MVVSVCCLQVDSIFDSCPVILGIMFVGLSTLFLEGGLYLAHYRTLGIALGSYYDGFYDAESLWSPPLQVD